MEQVNKTRTANNVANTTRKAKRAKVIIVNKRKLILSCLFVFFIGISIIYGIKEWKETTKAIQQDAKVQTEIKTQKSVFPSEVFGVMVHNAILDVGAKRKARNKKTN